MKLISKTFIIACLSMSVITASAQLSGLGSLLGGDKEEKTSQSGLGGILDAIGVDSDALGSAGETLYSTIENVVEGVVYGNKEVTLADLQGEWAYRAPACKFLSENLLESAGGELVATQVVDKATPIYQKLGFSATNFGFTFDEEGGYIMTYRKMPISGSVTKTEKNAYFTLEFVKIGQYTLAKTPVYINVYGDKMLLLFEADKFINLFRTLVGYIGVDSLDSIFELVDNYDGILVGFELTRK